MRLLAVLAQRPTPFHGAALRSYHFLRLLRERHGYAVRVVCLAPSDGAIATELRFCDGVIEVPVPAGGTLAKWRWSLRQHLSWGNLLSRDVALLNPDYSLEMARLVDKQIEDWCPDALFAGSLYCGHYLSGRDLPSVIDAIDAIPEGYRRLRTGLPSTHRTAATRAFYLAMERTAVRELHRVASTGRRQLIATTPREAAWLEGDVPGLHVKVIANGVDLNYFQPSADESTLPTLAFTGALSAPSNRDAVRWFVDYVLPAVRLAVPDVRLLVVGSAAPPDILALDGVGGIEVHSNVEDVRPYLAQSWVCVVPNHGGQGVSNKLLEAMAVGRPAVVTPAQVEGVGVVPGEHVFVAADAPAFAAACMALVQDRSLRLRMAGSARTYIEANHSWCRETDRLHQLFEGLLA